MVRPTTWQPSLSDLPHRFFYWSADENSNQDHPTTHRRLLRKLYAGVGVDVGDGLCPGRRDAPGAAHATWRPARLAADDAHAAEHPLGAA